MEQLSKPKKTSTGFPYIENLSENEQITEYRVGLAQTTVEALQMKHGKTDTTIQTNNAFNSRLDLFKVKEKSLDQIIKKWQEETDDNMFKTLGTEFEFTEISQDLKSIFVNRDPLIQMNKQSTVASLFDHKVTHSILHNTFSKEDSLIDG